MSKSRYLWLIGVASLLYLAAAPRFYVGHFGDDARDILAAQSLLSGHYSNLQFPQQPALNFPLPGFPLFLAPFVSLIGNHWDLLKAIPLLLTLASLVLLRKLFSSVTTEKSLMILVGLMAFNPMTLYLSSSVIADSLYLAVLLSVFLVLRRQTNNETLRGSWFLGGLIAWAAMIRPEGLPLALAVAVAVGIHRQWRLLVITLMPTLAIWAFWIVRNLLLTGQVSGYSPLWREALAFQASGYGAFFAHGAVLAQKVFVELLLGVDLGFMTPARWFVVAAITGAAVMLSAQGLARCAKESRWSGTVLLAIFLYAVLHLWLHLAWSAVDAHYFWPLLPFLFFFMHQGLSAHRLKPLVLKLFCGGVGILYFVQIALALQDPWRSSQERALPRETLAWIRANIPQDAFLLAPNAPVVTLYTRRYAMALLGARNAEDFHARLVLHKIGYVLVAPARFMFVKAAPGRDPQKLWERIGQTLPASPKAYTLVYSNPKESIALYKVLPKRIEK